jgi:hypothetical protein
LAAFFVAFRVAQERKENRRAVNLDGSINYALISHENDVDVSVADARLDLVIFDEPGYPSVAQASSLQKTPAPSN